MKKHSKRFYRALPVAFALSALVVTSSVWAESPDEPTRDAMDDRRPPLADRAALEAIVVRDVDLHEALRDVRRVVVHRPDDI